MSIFEYFEHVQIINLPRRTDRFQDMRASLRRVGAAPRRGKIEFFPAYRPLPSEAIGWPSVGARGCFASHLAILKRARSAGWPRVLVMEDDLEIDPRFSTEGARLVEQLESKPWQWVYFAYNADPSHPVAESEQGVDLVDYPHSVVTASFYAIDRSLYTPLIDFLEAVERRPPGSPEGGPMHVDGAFWIFRRDRPEVRTLVASPALGHQRSSASDITPGWKDTVPGVRRVVAEIRRIKRRLSFVS